MRYPVGVMADSLRLPLYASLLKAKELGAEAVQLSAVSGEFTYENYASTDVGRMELRGLLSRLGLRISAVCGDLGGRGFMIPEENPSRIRASRRIMELASLFECPVVTTHIGAIPRDTGSPRYQTMLSACRELGRIAEGYGGAFAVETGPEEPERLKAFLDEVGSPGMKVNYDPANLVMVTRSDPVRGVFTLKDYIVHVHAKDGVNLLPCDPERIYGPDAPDIAELLDRTPYFRETPLGEGAVDLLRWIAALEEIGYRGAVTVERETGADPASDIEKAIKALRTL